METESHNMDSLEAVSSSGDSMHELETAAETLLRVELDIACSSEKLVNLEILVMHVASRENDFEAFASEEENTQGDNYNSVVKAFEYDLLYGILDSEVGEMESFLSDIQLDIAYSREVMSLIMHLGDIFTDMEDRLQDCEYSLEQSFEQISDIKTQSTNFRRILLASSGDEKWKDGKELDGSENCSLSDLNAKIKMQTAEQQKSILRMLEKSLAREMDLEKRLTESREAEEDLKLQLQEEVFCMEQEAEDMLEKLLVAENNAEILSGVSKELCGKIQLGFKDKTAADESNLELNNDLICLKGTITDAYNKVEELEKQLKESETKQEMLDSTIRDLKSSVLRAESQVESAEDKCVVLSERNGELVEEMRRRVKCFETSLRQADEAKKQTAKDIRLRTQLITDLVFQLALERERLHKQISSMAKEKNIGVKYLHSENDCKNGTFGKESNEDKMVFSATSSEMGNTRGESSTTGRADDVDTVRNIDARQLEFKYVFIIIFVLLIPAFLFSTTRVD